MKPGLRCLHRFWTAVAMFLTLLSSNPSYALSFDTQLSSGLIFGTGSSSPTTERMRITQGGLIGISNTAPKAKLDVVGTISASDLIQVGQNSGATCSSAISGSLRYSTTSSTVEYCNSTTWTSLGPSDTVPIGFRVYKNANQTVTTNTNVKVTWSTESFDTNNNFASDKFTPTVPGYYFIHARLSCSDSTQQCVPELYKNGSVIAQQNTYNSGPQFGSISEIVYMNGTTDYLEIYVYNGGGTTISAANPIYNVFTGFLIGPQASSGGGGATTAGSTYDVQFNNAGALAADTGNFTYNTTTDALSAPTVSGTYHYGQYASYTTIYNTSSFSGNTIAANSVSSTVISGSTISGTLIQPGASGATCAAAINGAIRYNSTSNTLQVCAATTNVWTSLSSGTLAGTGITGTGSSGYVPYWTGASTQSYDSTAGSQFYWDSTNHRLGIGTTAPAAALHASGTTILETFTNKKITFGNALTTAANISDFSSMDASMGLSRANDGTQNIGGIFVYNTSKLGIASYGDIVFATGASSTWNNAYDRMRITSAGNVGIGTSAPSRLLEISSSVSGGARMRLTGTNATAAQYSTYEFYCGTAGTTWCGGLAREQSTNDISLWTANNSVTPKMVITNAGNVGIGTTTPQTTLQVSGSFTVSTSAQTTTPSIYVGTNGYVGIGKTSPGAALDVSGDALFSGASVSTNQGGSIELGCNAATCQNTTTGGLPYIDFHYGTGSSQDYTARFIASGSNRLDLAIPSYGTVMTISGSNVGIGTTTPNAKLDVAGLISTSSGVTYPDGYTQTHSGDPIPQTTNTSTLIEWDTQIDSLSVWRFDWIGASASYTIQISTNGGSTWTTIGSTTGTSEGFQYWANSTAGKGVYIFGNNTQATDTHGAITGGTPIRFRIYNAGAALTVSQASLRLIAD